MVYKLRVPNIYSRGHRPGNVADDSIDDPLPVYLGNPVTPLLNWGDIKCGPLHGRVSNDIPLNIVHVQDDGYLFVYLTPQYQNKQLSAGIVNKW